MTVHWLTRGQWGAGPLGAGHQVSPGQFVGLVVHHTVIVMPDYDHDSMIDGDIDDVIQYMQQLKVARPDLGNDVPYSFVVFKDVFPGDCIVAEGRGVGMTGAHTIGYNSTRYGCAFAGDFTNVTPTAGMWEGVRWVGRAMLLQPDKAQPTLEHRDVYATQCPGNATENPALAQPPFTANQPPEEDMPRKALFILLNHDTANPKPEYLSTDELMTCRWVTSPAENTHLRTYYKRAGVIVEDIALDERPTLIGPEPH